ncbi:hypothetical protein T265_08133 [Opisthorchis viverrini]|uniref:Uncharacterized protein n=1 Tax=Opisthorchis viverrini TaxID=6198 RepID=A0A074ZLD6_OPIVI|nr:hypothetical protein T265_08133 [Opisthorchis viverrini]KER24145.1 hypothetical protein T265_08133 [Opisthorchis viverrini]
MPPEGSTRAGILSGCPSLDRGSRVAEVGFEPRTFRSFGPLRKASTAKQLEISAWWPNMDANRSMTKGTQYHVTYDNTWGRSVSYKAFALGFPYTAISPDIGVGFQYTDIRRTTTLKFHCLWDINLRCRAASIQDPPQMFIRGHQGHPVSSTHEKRTGFRTDAQGLTRFQLKYDKAAATKVIQSAQLMRREQDSRQMPKGRRWLGTDSRIDTQDRGFCPSFPGRSCSCRSVAVVRLKGTSKKRV